jgi:hypothetical protein
MATLRRMFSIALTGAPFFLGFCQQPQVAEVKQPPDWILYDSFLFRMRWMEQVAEKSAAAGGDPAAVRLAIPRQAGLTTKEAAVLSAVAADWWQAISALQDEKRARQGAGLAPPGPQQSQDYSARYRRITEEAVDRLRTALGPARFAQLDGFVRATSNVKVMQISPPPAPSEQRSEAREAP